MTYSEIISEINAIKNESQPNSITANRLGVLLDAMMTQLNASVVQSSPHMQNTMQSASFMSVIPLGSTVVVPAITAYSLPELYLSGTLELNGFLTLN